jgi:hypothetical protein
MYVLPSLLSERSLRNAEVRGARHASVVTRCAVVCVDSCIRVAALDAGTARASEELKRITCTALGLSRSVPWPAVGLRARMRGRRLTRRTG